MRGVIFLYGNNREIYGNYLKANWFITPREIFKAAPKKKADFYEYTQKPHCICEYNLLNFKFTCKSQSWKKNTAGKIK